MIKKYNYWGESFLYNTPANLTKVEIKKKERKMAIRKHVKCGMCHEEKIHKGRGFCGKCWNKFMDSKKITVCFADQDELHEQIILSAEKNFRSTSNEILFILSRYLEVKKNVL